MQGLHLTLSGRRTLLYRNHLIDLLCKSMGWFLNDKVLRHERVNNHTNDGIGKAMKCVDFLGRSQYFLPYFRP